MQQKRFTDKSNLARYPSHRSLSQFLRYQITDRQHIAVCTILTHFFKHTDFNPLLLHFPKTFLTLSLFNLAQKISNTKNLTNVARSCTYKKLRHGFTFTLIIVTDCHLIIIIIITTITLFLLHYCALPSQYHTPQAVLHSIKLLKMGRIVARNMSS